MTYKPCGEDSESLRAKVHELDKCIARLSACVSLLEKKSSEYERLIRSTRELWGRVIELRDKIAGGPSIQNTGLATPGSELGLSPAEAVNRVLREVDRDWKDTLPEEDQCQIQ
jgi:hypothetical protein